jgi:DNA-binding HxlR family transcriptional regulator
MGSKSSSILDFLVETKEFSLQDYGSSGIANQKIWDIVRGLSKKHAITVAKPLFLRGPMNFSELLDETELSRNILNHTLQEMKKEGLIVLEDGKYKLTTLCVLMLVYLNNLRYRIKDMPFESLVTTQGIPEFVRSDIEGFGF